MQAIVEERDQERERRWKAEQATKRLSEQVKNLQTRASEEKDLQSLALHTTDRWVHVESSVNIEKYSFTLSLCSVLLLHWNQCEWNECKLSSLIKSPTAESQSNTYLYITNEHN